MNYSEKYTFGKARSEDLKTIEEIETEFFGDYVEKYDIAFLEKWFKYNSNMFLVVRDIEKDEVVGFTITVPITGITYERLLNGDIHDMGQFEFYDVLTSQESEYYYFADICLSNRKTAGKISNKLYALVAMMDGIQQHLDSTGVQHIISTSITDDGLKSALGMGFNIYREYSIDGYNRPVYTTVLNVTSEKRMEILGRMTKIKTRLKGKKG